MTFLQQTLGKNYKWWYVAKYNFAVANAGIAANLMSSIPKIISSLTVIFIWSKANPSIAIFTYLIIGRIYKSFCDGFGDAVVSMNIIDGSLTSEIIRPNDYFSVRFFAYCGRRALRNLLEILTFSATALISVYLFSPIQISSWLNFLFVLLFVPISFFVNFAIGYMIGSFAFFLKNKREYMSVRESWESIKPILFGLLIPLTEMPFTKFFEFLPTAYFLHHPMQIYLGKYDNAQILQTFGGGIVWCLVLWILARLVFKAGLKRNEAVGL